MEFADKYDNIFAYISTREKYEKGLKQLFELILDKYFLKKLLDNNNNFI